MFYREKWIKVYDLVSKGHWENVIKWCTQQFIKELKIYATLCNRVLIRMTRQKFMLMHYSNNNICHHIWTSHRYSSIWYIHTISPLMMRFAHPVDIWKNIDAPMRYNSQPPLVARPGLTLKWLPPVHGYACHYGQWIQGKQHWTKTRR